MNCDLIFSAEMTCWPDIALAQKHPNTSSLSPYKYLNSGGFIGKAGYIKELMGDIDIDMENFKRSNQYIWMQRYLKKPDSIAIDINCEIFSTFTPQMALPVSQDDYAKYFSLIDEWFDNNFLLEKGRVFNNLTKTWPCHAHFNGFSKRLVNKYIVDMIYNQTPSGEKIQFFHEV
jgi:hypothetical protein